MYVHVKIMLTHDDMNELEVLEISSSTNVYKILSGTASPSCKTVSQGER